MLSDTMRKTEVELSLQTYGVIISLFEIHGIDCHGKDIGELTSKVVTLLMSSLLEDGAVDQLDDNTLIKKLSPYFSDLKEQLSEKESELAEIEEKLKTSPTPQHPSSLSTENLPEDLFSDPEKEEVPSIDFDSLDQSDPLVKICQEDETKRNALCRVYARIPKEKRGSDQAAKLLSVELGE